MGFLWDLYNSLADNEKSADCRLLLNRVAGYEKVSEKNNCRLNETANTDKRKTMQKKKTKKKEGKQRMKTENEIRSFLTKIRKGRKER